MERPLVAGLRYVPVMGSFLLNSATISTSRGRYAAGRAPLRVAFAPHRLRHTPANANELHLYTELVTISHRPQTAQIRTCIVFLDHVQNLHIHAVRARSL
eukprot:COSAG05_NODE_180_length_14817_cov_423.925262_6_plen_100_part_00